MKSLMVQGLVTSIILLGGFDRSLADGERSSRRVQQDRSAPKPEFSESQAGDTPEYRLLDAMNRGLVAVEAEGKGDGRMTVSVTNQTRRQLRVVLPPGLIAQGASGQMGGMGGMGGGMMGGMGGMGGGMMGGMGGMGGGMMGGMGGMGGGMGGGMMGGRGMGGGT
ncbi:MAG: hypothetical protein U0790_27425, partial [Isosphaeraceae bacterium]